MAESTRIVRKAYGSGRWFPGGHGELVSAVEGYIDAAEVEPVSGRIVGAIAPHAGYVYSGPIAGYTFRALRDNVWAGSAPTTVVILGFSHRGGFPGVALMDGDAVATPVGETDLDREVGDMLVAASPLIHYGYRPHKGEHSAENIIPFAQVALPDARLVVGIIGDHELATREALAQALHQLSGRKQYEPATREASAQARHQLSARKQHEPATRKALAQALQQLSARKRIVVVASTDLLHDASYERVCSTDKKTLAKIAALDEAGLKAAWSFAEQVCCGVGPVLTTMRFAKLQGADSGSVLRYRNSGDDHPESRGSWVVGYGAVVFARPDKAE